jgi:hypothetical protein
VPDLVVVGISAAELFGRVRRKPSQLTAEKLERWLLDAGFATNGDGLLRPMKDCGSSSRRAILTRLVAIVAVSRATMRNVAAITRWLGGTELDGERRAPIVLATLARATRRVRFPHRALHRSARGGARRSVGGRCRPGMEGDYMSTDGDADERECLEVEGVPHISQWPSARDGRGVDRGSVVQCARHGASESSCSASSPGHFR